MDEPVLVEGETSCQQNYENAKANESHEYPHRAILLSVERGDCATSEKYNAYPSNGKIDTHADLVRAIGACGGHVVYTGYTISAHEDAALVAGSDNWKFTETVWHAQAEPLDIRFMICAWALGGARTTRSAAA
jgi:hypothetical protein